MQGVVYVISACQIPPNHNLLNACERGRDSEKRICKIICALPDDTYFILADIRLPIWREGDSI